MAGNSKESRISKRTEYKLMHITQEYHNRMHWIIRFIYFFFKPVSTTLNQDFTVDFFKYLVFGLWQLNVNHCFEWFQQYAKTTLDLRTFI